MWHSDSAVVPLRPSMQSLITCLSLSRFVDTARRGLFVCVGALALTLALRERALAVQVNCGTEGDGFGWAVDAGADFDGDGVPDIAVGAPCAKVGGLLKVGRVRVFSGATHRRLLSLSGEMADQQFGSAIALVPDLDGDGKAELAVGSSTFAPKKGSGTINRAGKFELFSSKGGVKWTLTGTTHDSLIGEAVAVVADIDGDGKADLMVGGSGVDVAGEARGTAYILSGVSGALLGRNDGERQFDYWGSTLGSIGDVDGDGHPDLVVASNSADRPLPAPLADVSGADLSDPSFANPTSTGTPVTTTTFPADVGRVKIISGFPPFAELARMEGDVDERLGRSVAATSDLSGDSLDDLWVGSIGSDVGNQAKAGIVALYTSLGIFVRSLAEPTPQAGAGFGMAVVVPGSVNGDGVEDVVASAPNGTEPGTSECGRVHAFDGSSGAVLWSRSGAIAGARLGQSLAGGFDYDGDGVGDVVVGAPGDAPAGRRGAGSAYVLSGADGQTLARLGGRRGRETRLFVAGLGDSRRLSVRSFDPFGHVREADIAPFRSSNGAAATLAVFDDAAGAAADAALLAVGTGRGGSAPEVVVYRAGRRRSGVLSRFQAGPAGYSGGVNIAAGDLSSEAGDEIAAAPADASGASIDVVIHRRWDTDPLGRSVWTPARTFPLFAAGDTVLNRTVGAVGVNLAAGNLTDAPGDELVAGPIVGLPAVRVFNRAGTRIGQWLAYPPEGTGSTPNVGTMVAVGDLDGSGFSEVVTAPAAGQPWIRAWTIDGNPFVMNGKSVSFFCNDYGPNFSGGLRLVVADVDFDGQGEIVVAPGPGVRAPILAFEADGKPVVGWTAFMPFGPALRSGLMLAASDFFLRR